MATKLLDLDAVHTDLSDVGIKLAGAIHKLKPLSVLDYIENTKLMQRLRLEAGDMEKEFEATIEIVARSFPTIQADDLRKLTFIQLNKLVAFARQANGETAIDEAVQAPTPAEAPAGEVASIGSENPPAARSPSTSASSSQG